MRIYKILSRFKDGNLSQLLVNHIRKIKQQLTHKEMRERERGKALQDFLSCFLSGETFL